MPLREGEEDEHGGEDVAGEPQEHCRGEDKEVDDGEEGEEGQLGGEDGAIEDGLDEVGEADVGQVGVADGCEELVGDGEGDGEREGGQQEGGFDEHEHHGCCWLLFGGRQECQCHSVCWRCAATGISGPSEEIVRAGPVVIRTKCSSAAKATGIQAAVHSTLLRLVARERAPRSVDRYSSCEPQLMKSRGLRGTRRLASSAGRHCGMRPEPLWPSSRTVQLSCFMTSVCGQVQPLDVALLG
jgi:hypothetical protein